MYSAIVQDHFSKPRNVGPLDTATHKGTAGRPGDGPYVVLWFEVAQERIVKGAWQTFGCPGAISSASVAVELLTGRPVTAAVQLSPEEILQALEGLPEAKQHCPQLVIDALSDAFTKGA